MPVWLMFIPVVAIVQGIIILFVAMGQWITRTYYTMTPIDGGRGGRIEIFRDAAPDGSMRIEARLDDGRVFDASLAHDSRRAIVRGVPTRRAPSRTTASMPIELVATDGTKLTCAFTRSEGADAGGCVAPDGRGFRLIARTEPASPPPG